MTPCGRRRHGAHRARWNLVQMPSGSDEMMPRVDPGKYDAARRRASPWGGTEVAELDAGCRAACGPVTRYDSL